MGRLALSRDSIAGARFLLRFLKPYRGRFALAIVALLGSSLAGLAFPAMTGLMIDAATHRRDSVFGGLGSVALVFLGILGAQALLGFLRVYLSTMVAERVIADLRTSLYSKLLRMPMTFFHTHRVGELTSRLGSDVGQVQFMITTAFAELMRQSILLIGGITLVTWISPRLTLIVAVAIPAVVAVAVLFGRMLRRAGRRIQDLYASLNTIAEETFQGIAAVKAFSAERDETERYGSTIRSIIALSVRVALARGGFAAFISFVLFGGVVGIVWYGGRMVVDGSLSIGDLTSYVLYALFVGAAMGSFADLYGSFQGALGASERIRGLLAEDVEPLEETGAAIATGEISFRNVTFAYPTRPDAIVVDNVSFTVEAGKSIALVGPSGSGKSTIASLLMRFHKPLGGTIGIDSIDAETYALQSYRQGLAIVPQDVFLFGGTIEENIRYGRNGASTQDVRSAAQLANADEFIERLAEGYQTIVGERGVQLSGGQRQRIAIARAVLKNPSILILDEATSSLDSESEQLVQQALERATNGRTTVIIAHRLSTVRKANAIVVLRHGQVIESGTYRELIELGGVFARLIALQDMGHDDSLDTALLAMQSERGS